MHFIKNLYYDFNSKYIHSLFINWLIIHQIINWGHINSDKRIITDLSLIKKVKEAKLCIY